MPLSKGAPPSPEHLLTLSQASVALGISTRTLRRWRKTRKIPTYRVAGKCRILRMDVDQLLTPQEEK